MAVLYAKRGPIMERQVSNMRYYIATTDGIPYREQPANRYTKLQVIARVQREIEECVKLWGGKFSDYKGEFLILDKNFHEVHDFDDAI